jgi:hypothetical protein
LFIQDRVVIRALHGNSGAAEDDVQYQRRRQERKSESGALCPASFTRASYE